MKALNILLTSAGRRTKIVQYFKDELRKYGGKVIAVDCDPNAPALYFADHFEVVPRITDPSYISIIKEICVSYNVRGLISLIDPELLLLSKHIEEFKTIHVDIIVSDPDAIRFSYDKYETYQQLKKYNIVSIPTYLSIESVLKDIEERIIDFPLVIKPRTGSASLGLQIVHSLDEIRLAFEKNNDQEMIIQPYIHGKELGIDVYIDLISGEPVSMFVKQKLKMRAGETDKSIAIKAPDLFTKVKRLLEIKTFRGPIDIDCFKTESGYVISEINPRFGGGYPHAHEAGVNFVKLILNNLLGNINSPSFDQYREGTKMLKYDNVLFIE